MNAVFSVTTSSVNQTSSISKKRVAAKPLVTISFTLLVLLLLVAGWLLRDEYFWTADHGTGYVFGILGGSMMLLLLAYPLRKHFQHTSLLIFSTRNWFKLHMFLGIVGPLLILYHCNFGLGSSNSNVALASMGLMVTSGLIGRFIYSRIHYGLYGEKIKLKELEAYKFLAEKELDDQSATDLLQISSSLSGALLDLEKSVHQEKGLLGKLTQMFKMSWLTRFYYFKVMQEVKKIKKRPVFNSDKEELTKAQKLKLISTARRNLEDYLTVLRKISSLSFYERLFDLWHMLHMPIFFMLIITGFVHVYAVHTY